MSGFSSLATPAFGPTASYQTIATVNFVPGIQPGTGLPDISSPAALTQQRLDAVKPAAVPGPQVVPTPAQNIANIFAATGINIGRPVLTQQTQSVVVSNPSPIAVDPGPAPVAPEPATPAPAPTPPPATPLTISPDVMALNAPPILPTGGAFSMGPVDLTPPPLIVAPPPLAAPDVVVSAPPVVQPPVAPLTVTLGPVLSGDLPVLPPAPPLVVAAPPPPAPPDVMALSAPPVIPTDGAFASGPVDLTPPGVNIPAPPVIVAQGPAPVITFGPTLTGDAPIIAAPAVNIPTPPLAASSAPDLGTSSETAATFDPATDGLIGSGPPINVMPGPSNYGLTSLPSTAPFDTGAQPDGTSSTALVGPTIDDNGLGAWPAEPLVIDTTGSTPPLVVTDQPSTDTIIADLGATNMGQGGDASISAVGQLLANAPGGTLTGDMSGGDTLAAPDLQPVLQDTGMPMGTNSSENDLAAVMGPDPLLIAGSNNLSKGPFDSSSGPNTFESISKSLGSAPGVQSTAGSLSNVVLDGSTVPYSPTAGWLLGGLAAQGVPLLIDGLANLNNASIDGTQLGSAQPSLPLTLDGISGPMPVDYPNSLDKNVGQLDPASVGIAPPTLGDIIRTIAGVESGIAASGYAEGGVAVAALPASMWVLASAAALAGGLTTQEVAARMAQLATAASNDTNAAAVMSGADGYAGFTPDFTGMTNDPNNDLSKVVGDPSLTALIGGSASAATNTAQRMYTVAQGAGATTRAALLASWGAQYAANQMSKNPPPNPDAILNSLDGISGSSPGNNDTTSTTYDPAQAAGFWQAVSDKLTSWAQSLSDASQGYNPSNDAGVASFTGLSDALASGAQSGPSDASVMSNPSAPTGAVVFGSAPTEGQDQLSLGFEPSTPTVELAAPDTSALDAFAKAASTFTPTDGVGAPPIVDASDPGPTGQDPNNLGFDTVSGTTNTFALTDTPAWNTAEAPLSFLSQPEPANSNSGGQPVSDTQGLNAPPAFTASGSLDLSSFAASMDTSIQDMFGHAPSGQTDMLNQTNLPQLGSMDPSSSVSSIFIDPTPQHQMAA